jgi:D-alanine-D-alanine ligase-like ATP-grasp enzyme
MQNKNLILGPILKKIAPRIGAAVFIEPVWGVVGRITFKSGKHSYFRYNTIDVNPVGSSDIAQDKDYANFFMKTLGYPTIPGSRTFFSDEWARAINARRRKIDDAYRYARRLGFPVIVKPNSGSQGKDVALVHNKREFYPALHTIFRHDRVALVQKRITGKDYRIVVLDDKIISAYERIPLNVTGDGRSTIAKLLAQKARAFIAASRDTRIKTDDPRILAKLKHQRLTLRSILPKGKMIYLLDNANLSTGGDSMDVTGNIHPAFRDLAVRLTKDMGLRLCGVDLMVHGMISDPPKTYWILEINAAPGLDHYASTGKAQQKIVEDLYLEVLKHLEL